MLRPHFHQKVTTSHCPCPAPTCKQIRTTKECPLSKWAQDRPLPDAHEVQGPYAIIFRHHGQTSIIQAGLCPSALAKEPQKEPSVAMGPLFSRLLLHVFFHFNIKWSQRCHPPRGDLDKKQHILQKKRHGKPGFKF